LFGNDDPIGKSIEFEGNRFSERNKLFTVQGIYEDFPSNSHFQGNFILSLLSFVSGRNSNPTNHMLTTYIRLKKPQNEKTVEGKFPKFMESFYGKNIMTTPDHLISSSHYRYTFKYHQKFITNMKRQKGAIQYIYFPISRLLIILIACFKFINLTDSEGVSEIEFLE
jgi:putative ABC transport system permease protein